MIKEMNYKKGDCSNHSQKEIVWKHEPYLAEFLY